MKRILPIIALGLLAIIGGPAATVCILFLLPSIVAWLTRHPEFRLILLVNLTVAWTLLGWLAAAALAMPISKRECASPKPQ